MSKVNIRVIVILTAIFVAFSVAAFALPFPKGVVFWIAYMAEAIAIAMQFFWFKAAFESGTELRSKVLGYPIARVGWIYLAAQTAASVVLFVLGAVFEEFPAGIAVAVCVIVLCAALVFGVIADSAREVVKRVESDARKETPIMRQLITESAVLPRLTDNSELRAQLGTLAEKFRYSDPVSSPELQAAEDELIQQMVILRNMVTDNDDRAAEQIKSITRLLDERNIMCKNYKYK